MICHKCQQTERQRFKKAIFRRESKDRFFKTDNNQRTFYYTQKSAQSRSNKVEEDELVEDRDQFLRRFFLP